MSIPPSDVIEHERVWVEGLNRGDVSGADRAFAPDCTLHITGQAEPVRGREAWKQFVGGLLTAFPDLRSRWKISCKLGIAWPFAGPPTAQHRPVR
jgi:SnoaL-like polyketide cyclase